MKALMTATALALFIAPASAAYDCTAANLAKAKTESARLPDGLVKEGAMREANTADDMMKKGDKNACAMHIDSAMKEVDKQNAREDAKK